MSKRPTSSLATDITRRQPRVGGRVNTKVIPPVPAVKPGHFIAYFISSTIGRASLLFGASIGAFLGTLVMYFLAINQGMPLNSVIILLFVCGGVLIGSLVDIIINFTVFLLSKR